MLEKENLNASLNPQLNIGAVSCSICGDTKIKHSIGHSFMWNGIYDVLTCKCGNKDIKKKVY